MRSESEAGVLVRQRPMLPARNRATLGPAPRGSGRRRRRNAGLEPIQHARVEPELDNVHIFLRAYDGVQEQVGEGDDVVDFALEERPRRQRRLHLRPTLDLLGIQSKHTDERL